MRSLTQEQDGVNPNCLESRPTPQSVKFGGIFLNLSGITRETGVDRSTVTKIFSGERQPTLSQARAISKNLGLTTDEFITLLYSHVGSGNGSNGSKVETSPIFLA